MAGPFKMKSPLKGVKVKPKQTAQSMRMDKLKAKQKRSSKGISEFQHKTKR